MDKKQQELKRYKAALTSAGLAKDRISRHVNAVKDMDISVIERYADMAEQKAREQRREA